MTLKIIWPNLILGGASPKMSVTDGSPALVSLFFFFAFLGPHMWHMEIPRLGV